MKKKKSKTNARKQNEEVKQQSRLIICIVTNFAPKSVGEEWQKSRKTKKTKKNGLKNRI